MPGSEQVNANLAAWADRLYGALVALSQQYAQRMEAAAQQQAAWNDRTGHRRRSLQGIVEAPPDRRYIRVVLAGTDPVNAFLELGTGARGAATGGGAQYGVRYTIPIVIRPRFKKALRWVDAQGRERFAKMVVSRGMAARPVIRPVRDAHAQPYFEDVKRLVEGASAP